MVFVAISKLCFMHQSIPFLRRLHRIHILANDVYTIECVYVKSDLDNVN